MNTKTWVSIFLATAILLTARIGQADVVLLQNGNLLKGEVTQADAKVSVDQGSSRIRVDEIDVDRIFPTSVDAFRYLRAKLKTQDLEGHVRLGLWCLKNDLNNHAADQLVYASQLDPHAPSLKLLESQLATAANGSKIGGMTVLPTAPDLPDNNVLTDDDMERLETVPQSDIAFFTRQIQPILLNRCSDAKCHGKASDNDFHFENAPYASARKDYTSRNLLATLNHMNSEQVSQSSLLVNARTPHGGASEPPISPNEVQLLERIVAWIGRFAPIDAPTATEPPGLLAIDTKNAKPIDGSKVDLNARQATHSVPVNQPKKTSARTASAVTEQVETHESHSNMSNDTTATVRLTMADPFDPNTFNRRFHADRMDESDQ
ncbi:MAG: hypothetical protein KDA87_17395 [Planctomycetales bacterium]|nr:hypothetical protein [Planctomycetales bacterium]